MTGTQHTFQSHAPSYVLSSLTCQLLFGWQASPTSPLSSPWTYSIIAFMLQVKLLPSLGLYFLTFICLNQMELPRQSSNAAFTAGSSSAGQAPHSHPLWSYSTWFTHLVTHPPCFLVLLLFTDLFFPPNCEYSKIRDCCCCEISLAQILVSKRQQMRGR